MLVCSFGRDFLSPGRGSRPASPARVRAAMAAARSRWPDGRAVVSGRGSRRVWCWMVPRGLVPAGSDLCGLMVSVPRGAH